jgi:hypothetical protein
MREQHVGGREILLEEVSVDELDALLGVLGGQLSPSPGSSSMPTTRLKGKVSAASRVALPVPEPRSMKTSPGLGSASLSTSWKARGTTSP